ncbi:unnamed protein product, partial [Iphiclides podalirius]
MRSCCTGRCLLNRLRKHDVSINESAKSVSFVVLPTSVKDKEFLVKVEWISVDPYQRAYNQFKEIPYDQFGYQVGTVEQSKDINFPVGVRVVTHKGENKGKAVVKV